MMEVPVDTVAQNVMQGFDWIIEKEIWFDPSDFSFFTITESTFVENDENKKYKKPFKLEDVDRPPYYSQACLDAENPWECSREKISETIQDEIEYPEKALRKDHDGKEIVMFTVNEYGQIEGNYKVLSKDEPCAECAKAAVEAVAKLKEWYPAMKDGHFVKTEISIPVKFKLVE